jgi:hypothetical protein
LGVLTLRQRGSDGVCDPQKQFKIVFPEYRRLCDRTKTGPFIGPVAGKIGAPLVLWPGITFHSATILTVQQVIPRFRDRNPMKEHRFCWDAGSALIAGPNPGVTEGQQKDIAANLCHSSVDCTTKAWIYWVTR